MQREYRRQKSASKVQCVPCAICNEYATDNALANGAQIAHRFGERFATPTPGREQPSGPASGRTVGAEPGGCSRPRSISDAG